MFENREGLRIGRDQEEQREAAIEKARCWTVSAPLL
jgi:hypothetical protein